MGIVKIEALKTEYRNKMVSPIFFMENEKIHWNAETYTELKQHPGREAVELGIVEYIDHPMHPDNDLIQILVRQGEIPQLVRSAIVGGSIALGSEVRVTKTEGQTNYRFHNHYTLSVPHDVVAEK